MIGGISAPRKGVIPAMRILIVDDNNDYRKLLRRIVEEQTDIVVVAEASSGEEGVRLARQFKPDVILMDINMQGTNGLQATRRIKQTLGGTVVLILSASDSEADRERAVESGADAYLVKTMSIFEILSVIRNLRPRMVA
jgi:DNA-binding response OmpR family regulator